MNPIQQQKKIVLTTRDIRRLMNPRVHKPHIYTVYNKANTCAFKLQMRNITRFDYSSYTMHHVIRLGHHANPWKLYSQKGDFDRNAMQDSVVHHFQQLYMQCHLGSRVYVCKKPQDRKELADIAVNGHPDYEERYKQFRERMDKLLPECIPENDYNHVQIRPLLVLYDGESIKLSPELETIVYDLTADLEELYKHFNTVVNCIKDPLSYEDSSAPWLVEYHFLIHYGKFQSNANV